MATEISRLDRATLRTLIGSVYDAVEDPQMWEPLLLSLSRPLGAAGTAMISHDLVASGSVMVQAGIHPEALTLYNEHYHTVDIWAAAGHRILSRAAPTRVHLDQTMRSRHELHRSEYYPSSNAGSLSPRSTSSTRIAPARPCSRRVTANQPIKAPSRE